MPDNDSLIITNEDKPLESKEKAFREIFDNKPPEYVQDYEEEEALKTIVQHLGFYPPSAEGWFIIAKIYVRPEDLSTVVDEKTGEKKTLVLPTEASAHDFHKSNIGLVLSVGPACFKGKRFEFEPKPRCRVGDWIGIASSEGYKFKYRGTQMKSFADDLVLFRTPCPTYIDPWS